MIPVRPEKMAKVQSLIEQGKSVNKSCNIMKISPATYYRWRKGVTPSASVKDYAMGKLTLHFEAQISEIPGIVNRMQAAGLGDYLCTFLFEK